MKNNPVLTTQELSKYLKLNEKTVLKMAQSGQLPGFKIANQWRFYLSVIDEYLQDRIVMSPDNGFGKYSAADNSMPLSRLVEQEHIDLDLKADTRDAVLGELAEISQDAGMTDQAGEVSSLLIKRENMLSTAVGNGVAVPHPRNSSDKLFSRTGIIIARSIKGIDFHSYDNKKVHLFFMLCATDVVLHLKLLAKIAKFLESENIVKRFMDARVREDIVKILMENERLSLAVS